MKRGLVIGKFMPLHNGHIALINFAAAQCDELIVSMSFTEHDPIDAELRFHWIKATFTDKKIRVEKITDNFDNESLALDARTALWAPVMKQTYPPIHILFSSEAYGEPFAHHLGATHVAFDPSRSQVPVSATKIRQQPFRYWEHIPAVVRPYFVKKICFFGPESTGKSTMAQRMAAHYHTEFVPEVARELLTSNDFTLDDIAAIGHAQYNRVIEKTQTANKLLFCDTDAITTQIYSRHYLNAVPEIVHELEHKVTYDLYFLMDIDVPWIADGLRDLGDHREKMLHVFRAALEQRNIPFIDVRGSYEQREAVVRKAVDAMLDSGRG
ncbi:AAA family ATPase [Chryseolinea lacunae]|uniref:AAA family ATPase n=1 Tax=Chryseolinea lacunae TaxID=2801331 RepID=A0ABS1KW14_9BACT|nr:AAA family ATPase [Chryseolinea lacunae]MBL0743383.1 AAA family ATPase [Chryseolinea lacunae]